MELEAMQLLAQVYRTYGGVLGIAVFALQFIVSVSILAGRGSVRHKLVWTPIVLLLPVAGLILYLVWGRSDRDRTLLE